MRSLFHGHCDEGVETAKSRVIVLCMDSHFMLVRAVATLARRQIALEALLQSKGISKEDIAEAAGQVPIPPIDPSHFPIPFRHYQKELEEILKALGQ